MTITIFLYSKQTERNVRLHFLMILGTAPSDIGFQVALADPNELADPMRGPVAGRDLAPHRLLGDAEPLGDLGDAQKAFSRFGRTTFFSGMASLRVLQVRPIKQERIVDRAPVEGVSEDAESFPRRLPRDHSNELG
jgi:hypothetical protein